MIKRKYCRICPYRVMDIDGIKLCTRHKNAPEDPPKLIKNMNFCAKNFEIEQRHIKQIKWNIMKKHYKIMADETENAILIDIFINKIVEDYEISDLYDLCYLIDGENKEKKCREILQNLIQKGLVEYFYKSSKEIEKNAYTDEWEKLLFIPSIKCRDEFERRFGKNEINKIRNVSSFKGLVNSSETLNNLDDW